MHTTSLVVPDMSCAHCEAAIEDALSGLDGVGHVAVDLSSKVVAVEHDPDVAPATMADAITGAGYDVSGYDEAH